MPDVQPDPTAPVTASPTGTPTTAATSTVASPSPEPWRVPMDDSRAWARGKTAQEVLMVSDQMLGALQQVANQPAYAPSYSPAPSSPPVNWQDIKDDDVVDGKTIKQLAGAFQQGLSQVQGNPTQQAQMAYSMVRAESRYASLFADYEPEILMELRQLGPQLWTLDNVRTVVSVVAARHLDELAEKRAQAKFANMQGLPYRADGLGAGAPGQAGMESDGLPTNWQEILSKKGLDLPMVRSFCASNNLTVKKWFEMEGKMPSTMGSR